MRALRCKQDGCGPALRKAWCRRFPFCLGLFAGPQGSQGSRAAPSIIPEARRPWLRERRRGIVPVNRRRRPFCLVLSIVPGLLASGLVLLGGPGVVWPGPFCLVLSILGRFLAGGLLRAGGRPARALLLPLVSLALSLVRLVARRRLARGFTLGPAVSSVYNAGIDLLTWA